MTALRPKASPLLCELHAHTTWSDGVLGVRALCDLYGQNGFDVLAVIVLPGLELTYAGPDPLVAGHAVALGLRSFVDFAPGLERALASARASGAALVAAHPYSPDQLEGATRGTAAFAGRPELRSLVDRFELFNRHTLFGWVAAAGLASVANGDFHRLEHLGGWKTMIPCARTERGVVDYLRSSRPTYLVRLDESRRLRAA